MKRAGTRNSMIKHDTPVVRRGASSPPAKRIGSGPDKNKPENAQLSNDTDSLFRRKVGSSRPAGKHSAMEQVSVTVRDTTREILNKGRTLEKVVEIAATAQSFNEELTEHAKRLTKAPPVACQAGCSWCCFITVITTIPEVIRIAASMNKMSGSQAADDVRLDNVNEYVTRMRGLSLSERACLRVRCPMLNPVNGYCTLWDIRPLLCRGWNSADMSKCRHGYNSPNENSSAPVLRIQRDIAQAVGAGLVAGLEGAGLEGGAVYFIDALWIVLRQPDAVECWLAGQAVFKEAEVGLSPAPQPPARSFCTIAR